MQEVVWSARIAFADFSTTAPSQRDDLEWKVKGAPTGQLVASVLPRAQLVADLARGGLGPWRAPKKRTGMSRLKSQKLGTTGKL